jgi:Bacterial Ig-like domain (group 3)
MARSAFVSGSGEVKGSVTFYDGTTALKTMALSGGVAKFTTSTLTLGAHTIAATYKRQHQLHRQFGFLDANGEPGIAAGEVVGRPRPCRISNDQPAYSGVKCLPRRGGQYAFFPL